MTASSSATASGELSLGDRLRKARGEQGLSLRETADKLCLLAPCVQAIEENNYAYFKAAIFAKGYLRNYVKLLSLDEEQAMSEYEQYADCFPEQDVDFVFLEKQPNTKNTWLRNTIVAAMVGLLLLAAWSLWSNRTDETTLQQEASIETTETAQQALKTVIDPLVGSSVLVQDDQLARMEPQNLQTVLSIEAIHKKEISPKPETFPQLETRPQPTETVAINQNPVEIMTDNALTMTFTGDCWVKVVDAEGKTLVSDLKRADETVTVKGLAPFNIVVGNATMVAVNFNGEPVSIDSVATNKLAKFTVGES